MIRPKQIQLLLTEAMYPDIRGILKELRSLLKMPTNAQVTAFALRALHKRLSKQKIVEARRAVDGK